MIRGFQILTLVLTGFVLMSCFGASIDKRGTVYHYRDGLVKTQGGHFFVNDLPHVWKRVSVERRAIVFKNQMDQSTITISSWCKGAIDDAGQDTLSMNLLRVLKNQQNLSKRHVNLPKSRVATQMRTRGYLDGIPIYLKSYVIKMNECVFDFYYVSTPRAKSSEVDLDHLVEGFQFGSGPRIL